MRRIANSKSEYQRLIIRYKTKRREVMQEFRDKGIKAPSSHKRIVKISSKISTLTKSLRKIDLAMERLHAINEMVKYKYDLSMYKSVVNWKVVSNEKSFIRKMFCKYAIEEGILDFNVSRFIGYKYRNATRYRRQVNELIKKNDIALNKWHAFKKGMERDLKKLKTA